MSEDRARRTSQVSYELRNDGSSPIVAYVISWKFSGAPRTVPLYFASTFDSSIVGEPIQPDAVLKNLPYIAAQGQRLRSVHAEIAFIEFADGTRVGTAADQVGVLVDQNRSQLTSALRSYAQTLRELGPAGLEERLNKPFGANTPTAPATPCSAMKSARVVNLLRLLKREELIHVLAKYE